MVDQWHVIQESTMHGGRPVTCKYLQCIVMDQLLKFSWRGRNFWKDMFWESVQCGNRLYGVNVNLERSVWCGNRLYSVNVNMERSVRCGNRLYRANVNMKAIPGCLCLYQTVRRFKCINENLYPVHTEFHTKPCMCPSPFVPLFLIDLTPWSLSA